MSPYTCKGMLFGVLKGKLLAEGHLQGQMS